MAIRFSWKRAAATLACATALFLGCTTSRSARALLHPAPPPGPEWTENEVVIRGRNVSVDFALLKGARNDEMELALFDDEVIRIVRDGAERILEDGYVWSGRIKGDPAASVTLAAKEESLAGTIVTGRGRMFRIRYIAHGIHRLQEIDPSRFEPELEPVVPKIDPEVQLDACATDGPGDIDVLVAYTATARATAGGTASMQATVLLALAETNESYVNSNIAQRVRLAHMVEVAYAETGDPYIDLARLQDPSDGLLDNVPTLRNTYAADAVVLIVETMSGCGLGYLMETVSSAFENGAYSVVKRNCATGYYSFGHELGHNMGARHDWVNDTTDNTPYHYNHGHIEPSPSGASTPAWRTIMAYGSTTRLKYWSNPGVTYPPGSTSSDPMGTTVEPQPTDNRKTLNNTALTVANFRCSSPDVDNVWMKDTWNDTGKEPDAATAGEAMWKSPYIWVRNTQDTELVHQHQHEKLTAGSAPWVYVKIHNGGGTTASGTLELYYANASTSLDWPAAWTSLGNVAVTGFAAGSTRIVEQAWAGLPGAGHYCLLARWVSPADPMAVSEGTDIGVNVRNNNNLVWRNLNIVPLGADASEDALFTVRNSTEETTPTTLWVRGPESGRRPSFLPYGEVRVELTSELMGAWKQGGGQGSGFELRDGAFIIGAEGARIDNLVLPAGFEGRVSVRFTRLASTPRRDFEVDVVQLAKERTLGGVSYEIHTDRTE